MHSKYEQKTKTNSKPNLENTETRTPLIRFGINQSRTTSPYFLRRFLALFALSFWSPLEVNQNERQAGKERKDNSTVDGI